MLIQSFIQYFIVYFIIFSSWFTEVLYLLNMAPVSHYLVENPSTFQIIQQPCILGAQAMVYSVCSVVIMWSLLPINHHCTFIASFIMSFISFQKITKWKMCYMITEIMSTNISNPWLLYNNYSLVNPPTTTNTSRNKNGYPREQRR